MITLFGKDEIIPAKDWSGFHLGSESHLYLLWFCITTLRDWFKKLTRAILPFCKMTRFPAPRLIVTSFGAPRARDMN